MGSLTAFRVLRSLGGESNIREEADQITPELSSIRDAREQRFIEDGLHQHRALIDDVLSIVRIPRDVENREARPVNASHPRDRCFMGCELTSVSWSAERLGSGYLI